MSAVADLESKVVWHGEDVLMGDVLEALDRIRANFAREEAGDDEHPHPRSCVLTLIGITTAEADERLAEHTSEIIGAEHPVMAIVIREEHNKRRGKLDGWIRAEIVRPKTTCARECEIVTLHIDSDASKHVAELVDPLLESGVPIYVWWAGTPPFGKREIEEALRIADALVVDSARFEQPHHSFQGLAKLMTSAHRHLGMADLQWSRLRPWREMIAQFFSPLERRAFLNGISEVGIDYAGEGRGNRIGAAFTSGWLASSLGWKLQRAAAGAGGVVAAIYNAGGGRSVEVNFRSMPKEELLPGEISGVRIGGASRGRTFRLEILRNPERQHRPEPDDLMRDRRHLDNTHVLLTMIHVGEVEPVRHIQLVETLDEGTLLLDLLTNGTHDPVFNRSLAAASELIHKF